MDWNERATGWVEFETMLEATHAPVLHSLVARAGMMQGARVLDIGGGQDGRAERCGFFRWISRPTWWHAPSRGPLICQMWMWFLGMLSLIHCQRWGLTS
jgi:hypothetical protein